MTLPPAAVNITLFSSSSSLCSCSSSTDSFFFGSSRRAISNTSSEMDTFVARSCWPVDTAPVPAGACLSSVVCGGAVGNDLRLVSYVLRNIIL
uniref:Putative secreted protein n=1 Tax=Anopheles darlingi TaxID=43151 RepID=A0A2M4D3S3_ANODA